VSRRVSEQLMVNRIIEACQDVRAEYQAKLVRQHEEHIVELNRLRLAHHEQVLNMMLATIVARDIEWRKVLGTLVDDIYSGQEIRPH
jgi:hypothetical protein